MSAADRRAAKRSIAERPLVVRVRDGTIACATFREIERAKRIGAGGSLANCNECGAWVATKHGRTCSIVTEQTQTPWDWRVSADQCRNPEPQELRP